ncbi:NAD-dependent epimerase/dehydratase family protein [Amycolatopsis sp. K13G38]|uniref:NAD-dependent epimerase/dehydratase family protein n=1 Tax=Amycolatopsis acididurans TaxID=2724524 RepID=A0ABX1JCE1_9PSEU|nr:NAD-dependent epimerase/dehydratase family protein [Amycolatopsis acididurans]NKQ56050.1 NAD-dependent epimerase/dehydratase family protein [Amycolatopsis acididurans]
MRALVTGAAGFIGSHLIDALLADGHHVTGLDDLSTGDHDNLAQAMTEPRFRFESGSVLDHARVEALTAGADVVFHLAAAVGAFVIRDQTLEGLRTNIHGTENVIEAARWHNATLVFASTSEIYGKNTTIGLREDDDRVLGSTLKFRWSYAEAKAVDESLINAYYRARALSAVIVRPFNTVGPRQTGRYGMVVPRFVRQALAGEPLTVFGDGSQIRCFCHVADVVPALIALATNPRAQGRAVNLGSTEQVTIGELASRVLAVTGSRSEIRHISYEEAYGPGYEDMARRVPDCTLAGELVGFRPRYTLDQIIDSVAREIGGRAWRPAETLR